MKILIFFPTYHNEPQSLASIMALDNGEHDVHMLMTRTQKCDVGSYNILYNYRQGRAAMLAGDYDAMLTVEDDMILPADALTKLAAIDADIAAGMYVNRHKTFSRQPYIATVMQDDGARFISDVPGFVAGNWGSVVPVTGAGFGCALIRREVLAAINFQIQVVNKRHILADCDTWFYNDANERGYRIMLDMGIVCGHINNGAVHWPNRKGGISTTITTLTRQLLEAA